MEITPKTLLNLPEKAKKAHASTQKLFRKLQKSRPQILDDQVHEIHEDVFEETDCLTCANCCKTTSPIFYDKDIDRLAKYLNVKPLAFIDQYLVKDKDGDWVLKSAPCAFLEADNTCRVYDFRPTACREYPHTNRKRFYQIVDLTLKNTYICPAAFEIVERLKTKYISTQD